MMAGSVPLVRAMYPEIDCDTSAIGGFGSKGLGAFIQKHLLPMLKKQHSALIGVPTGTVSADDMVEIREVLPSEGFEWHDSMEWQLKFEELLQSM